jgi:hypothetical protein
MSTNQSISVHNQNTRFLLDYSALPMNELWREGSSQHERIAAIEVTLRRKYWSSISPHRLFGEAAQAAVKQYAVLAERAIAEIVRTRSIAYWLHAYRHVPVLRTSVDPMTAGLVRATLENAFQKYASLTLCDGIAWSDEILPERIFNGRFVRLHSMQAAAAIRGIRRLVLTDFGIDQLQQLWLLDQLAGDIHHCSVILRNIPRGASVVHTDNGFDQSLPPALERLIAYKARRFGRFDASATATVIDHSQTDGSTMFAAYNVLKVPGYPEAVARVITGRPVSFSQPPKFVWFTFPIRNFYETHRSFEAAFRERNGCELLAILFIMVGLSLHAIGRWRNLAKFMFHWEIALDEGVSRRHVLEKVIALSPTISKALNVPAVSPEKLEAAFDYLTLTEAKRPTLEPSSPGPIFMLLPFDGSFLVDYAWPTKILEYLFFGVHPENQNFKGDALEALVRKQIDPVLPHRACRAFDGTSKQVDASFISGDLLVIVECRAFAMSIGYDRGELDAQQYRINRIDKALRDISEKARWLADRPNGHNYNIDDNVQWICPCVVTPFVEFIPSLDEVYWLADDLARVLTPTELSTASKAGKFTSTVHKSSADRKAGDPTCWRKYR